jgi:hypothetical protein
VFGIGGGVVDVVVIVVVVKIMVDDGDVRMTMWRVAKIIFVSLVQSYGFQLVDMSTFCIFFVIFL